MKKNFVVGLGLSRTGTRSLGAALRLLGYRTIHFLGHRDDLWQPLWEDAMAARPVDLPAAFAAYDAITDIPGAVFHSLWLEQFRNVKFVLTWREPRAWLASMERHCGRLRATQGEGWEEAFGGRLHRFVYGAAAYDEAEDLR